MNEVLSLVVQDVEALVATSPDSHSQVWLHQVKRVFHCGETVKSRCYMGLVSFRIQHWARAKGLAIAKVAVYVARIVVCGILVVIFRGEKTAFY